MRGCDLVAAFGRQKFLQKNNSEVRNFGYKRGKDVIEFAQNGKYVVKDYLLRTVTLSHLWHLVNLPSTSVLVGSLAGQNPPLLPQI